MPSIPVRDAISRAKAALLDQLYADDPPKGLALEEIELVKDADRELWSVTLGFHRPKSVSAVQGGLLGSLYAPQLSGQVEHRVYKTVFIDATTGEFVKMEIRQVQ